MSNLDNLLERVQSEKVKGLKNPEKVSQTETPPEKVLKPSKRKFPWVVVVFVLVLGVGGYLYFDNKFNPIPPEPTNNIVKVVSEMENKYSFYKGEIFDKLATWVEEGKINNRQQLLDNAQKLLEDARQSTLGHLDKLDNEHINFDDDAKKAETIKYLRSKAEGFNGASK